MLLVVSLFPELDEFMALAASQTWQKVLFSVSSDNISASNEMLGSPMLTQGKCLCVDGERTIEGLMSSHLLKCCQCLN